MKVKTVFTQQQNYSLVSRVVNLVLKKKKKKEIQQWLFSSQKISVFLTGSQVLEPTEGLTVTFLSLSLLNTSPPRFIYKRVPYLLQKI